MQPPRLERAIAEIATRQHGCVSAAQLGALGLDRHAVARRVKAGSLHRVYAGAFAVGHYALTLRGRYLAAVLACGPDAALSYRSAADLWGLRRNSTWVEVTVPHGNRGAFGPTVHSSRLRDPDDLASIDGIPVTSVARTLLDLAAVLRERELGLAVDRAERLELFDLAAVEDALSRARGRRGAAALRRTVGAWRPRHTRSELEDRHAELVRGAGLPMPQLNVLLHGERDVHEVDAFWPNHGLVVQVDGHAWHRTRRDRERDSAADADLELAGLRVVRLGWDDVVGHPARTTRRLERLLHG